MNVATCNAVRVGVNAKKRDYGQYVRSQTDKLAVRLSKLMGGGSEEDDDDVGRHERRKAKR